VTLPQRLLSAWIRATARFRGSDSPWDRVPMSVPPTAFGLGSRRPFADYFEGESRVSVRTIDDIVEWLRGCEYVSDPELFHERDYWQHPGAFEQLRRGDCEDFALWTWRKLAEIGLDAEFVVGRVLFDPGGALDRHHAWVVFRSDDGEFLFEPAARDRERMIRPLDDVRAAYIPHFAVDRRLATCAFVGCTVAAL